MVTLYGNYGIWLHKQNAAKLKRRKSGKEQALIQQAEIITIRTNH